MSSGFITESEIAEQRVKRQEEWEKVRKPEDPEEAPEVQYDHRSLFDRLEEQKQKREMEYEETHKLKNMIRGLDDDEVNFLDLVEQSKMDAELRTSLDEARELREFRDARAKAEEASLDIRIKSEIKTRPVPASGTTNSSRSSQGRLLAGAVVRKRAAPTDAAPADAAPADAAPADAVPDVKKARGSKSPDRAANAKTTTDDQPDQTEGGERKRQASENGVEAVGTEGVAMRCIGILPGLGSYPDSSDSEASSDTDPELIATSQQTQFDLVGRKISRSKHSAASPASH